MPYVLTCPDCFQKYRVKESFSGRRFRCKACGEINQITDADIEDPEAVPARKSDSELPVMPHLPPVSTVASRKAKPVKKEEADDLDLDILSGRVDVLGAFNEEEAEEQRKLRNQMLMAGGGLVGFLIGFSLIYNFFTGGGRPDIPEEFEPYEFVQGEFFIDVPVDWEVKAGGGGNIPEYLTVKNDKIKFMARANPRGTIMKGIGGAAAMLADGPLDESSEPIHLAHLSMGEMMVGEYKDYEESDPQVIKPAGFGSARICRYSGGTQFFTTEYGFRASVSAGSLTYRILITCPAHMLDDLEPVAKQMVASIRPDVDVVPNALGNQMPIDDEALEDEEIVDEAERDPFTGELVE